jgi:prepilin-type N-terminal cleavage/methylation domain-containing protein
MAVMAVMAFMAVPGTEYYGGCMQPPIQYAMKRANGTTSSSQTVRTLQFAGFTLVELLVVLAIIGVLVAIIVPVALGARRAAGRMSEVSALRGVMTGWISYAADQNGFVLPGYKAGYSARDENGNAIPADAYGGDIEVSKRFPWRLAPWLDDDFRRLYVGANAETLAKLQAGDRNQYYYFASLYPSFGMNSAFVGGDDARFPSEPILANGVANPFAKYCVTRLSAAKRPQQTIVFSSARTGATTDGFINEGCFRVDAPWLNTATARWAAEYDPNDALSFGSVSARHGDEVVIGTIDGGVELLQVDALRDMTRWCDGAPEREWWIGK